MAKAKYLIENKNGEQNKFYPIGHTRAIYDTNGKVLEDRLIENENNIQSVYTKNEIDNKFSTLESNIDWKEAVNTFDDIITTYPNPEDGWTVNVKDTDYTYRYSGTEWVVISANAIPKATQSVDGLLSKEDKINYDDANSKKHTHDNKSVLDSITVDLINDWNEAKEHSVSVHARTDATKVEKSSTNGNIKINGVETVVYNGDQTPTFTEASTRSNINSGESMSTILGKIKKWFTDLKTVAFTGSYNDLSNKPTSMTPISHSSTSTTYGVGNSSSYGHLKLSDSTSSTSSTSSGVAATPKAVKDAYDFAKEIDETIESSLIYAGYVRGELGLALLDASDAISWIWNTWQDNPDYLSVNAIAIALDKKLNADNVNIRKNSDALDGDIIDTHLTVGIDNDTGTHGKNTIITGERNKASADSSAVIGGAYNSVIESSSVIIGGDSNVVDNTLSAIIGGYNNNAGGDSAIVIGGGYNKASGDNSAVIGGLYNEALANQVKMGHWSKNGNVGSNSGTSGDAFIIGNGSSSTAKSNCFRVDYSGKGYFAVSVSGTGADVAELYEWKDGNTENEDRCGYFVIVEGDKVRIANSNDDITKPQVMRRVGVVSGNPGLVANDYADDWQGKYLRDVYNRLITEHKSYDAEYEDREVTDPKTGETKIERIMIHDAYEADEYIVNPDYDNTQLYTPRHERPEWDYVSRHGQLPVNDDGTCVVNGYCRPSNNGVATSSDDGFYVMSRIDENHIMILI